MSMPSVHTATAIALAVRTNPKTSVFWVPLVVLIGHAGLDLIPHVEPWSFRLRYTHFMTPGFVWALTDVLLATWIVVKNMVAFPHHKRLLVLCFLAAVGPDVVEVFAKEFFADTGWGKMYLDLHASFHELWRNRLTREQEIVFGSITMFGAWFAAWKFTPHLHQQKAHIKSPATEELVWS